MSQDWLKMRMDLPTHPKVVRIVSAICPQNVRDMSERYRVIGGLHALWSVFDQHSEDGVLDGYTFDTMDAVLGWSGFCEAVAEAGWIEQTPQGIVMPRFSEHNGKSAKRRAEDTKRKRDARQSEECPQYVRNMSADEPDKNRTREEKEKEEEVNNPPTPLRGDSLDGFDAFWKEYPRKVAKEPARKAWKKLKLSSESLEELLPALRTAKASDQWCRDGGKYVPHPATWLNQRRWEDEAQPAGEQRELSEWELAELYAQQQAREDAA